MTQKQTTLSDNGLSGADSPDIGQSIETLTHYGHVRYEALENPGIVWYDPRDGREYYTTGRYDDFDPDEFDVDEELLTGIKIMPFRPESHGDPAARYVVREHILRKEVIDTTTEGWVAPNLPDEYVDTRSYSRSHVFEGIETAREWCRENIDGYEAAERRDAVRERVGDCE